jgi:hypothetical protein
MTDPGPGHSADVADRRERLESWKEIAAYLGRGVTTVQRWEQQEGLPIHRLPHAKKGSVFAIKCELDDWRRARSQSGPLHRDAVVDSPPRGARAVAAEPRRPLRLDWRAGVVLVALLGAAITGLAMSRMLGRKPSDAVAGNELVVPRPLASDAAAERCPSLSPDGSRVVYYWERAEAPGFYVKHLEGRRADWRRMLRALAFGAATPSGPRPATSSRFLPTETMTARTSGSSRLTVGSPDS